MTIWHFFGALYLVSIVIAFLVFWKDNPIRSFRDFFYLLVCSVFWVSICVATWPPKRRKKE